MDRAGIETMLMNYYRNIDREKLQFDFIVNKPKKGDYDDEIRKMGGNIYLSPGLNPIHYNDYMKFVSEIVRNNSDIKIVHAHNEAMGLYALNGAKKAGIDVRIAHAHNTKIVRDYKWPLKMFCKAFLPYSATDLWACGNEAGEYFFGKNNWRLRGMVMHNAIDTEKFGFSESVRKAVRKKYGLTGKTVIGHVGRFNVQKNHTRLLEIFSRFVKTDPNAVLFLAGEGELMDKMKEKAKELKISDKVIFAGLLQNTEEIYQAMDLFILPSLFEGLPVVAIEAQASGLPCVFSDKVTDEAILSGNAFSVSLGDPDGVWCEKIMQALKKENNRPLGKETVKNAGYDIFSEAERISSLYIKMAEQAYGRE